ncbi:MAG: 30S ribosomal protein S8 [bacterium]
MINDHISDMLTRVKNAYAMHKKTVSMPYTKVIESVAKVMEDEKYLSKVEVTGEKAADKKLVLTLSYKLDTAAVSSVKRISKPGVRIYRPLHSFRPVLSGMGIAILSTSKGIMSDRQAKIAGVGGEVLAELW